MKLKVEVFLSAACVTLALGASGCEKGPSHSMKENVLLEAKGPGDAVGVTHLTSVVAPSGARDNPWMPAKHPLQGSTIAILATDGVEQVELTEPREDFESAGAETILIAPKSGTIQAMNHAERGALLKVDMTLADADPNRFSGLLLPGGVASPDALRINPLAVAFVRSFVIRGKPVAAICHGPWLLIEAGAVRGKYVTSWPSLKTDLLNAGANWMDQPVVDDSGLITSRKPEDIPEFSRRAIEEFGKI